MAEAPWRQVAVPPPPPGATGHIPSNRLKSEISDRRVEPPLCVQNAMLTKDKKPFTYTPGGIDLSEIRSPRMARRLERNAQSEGVGAIPQPQHHQHPVGHLPPSALAAMQPQLSVQVFPSGSKPQPPQHHFAPPPPPCGGIPPPPPPPMKPSEPLPVDAFERPDMTKIIPDNPMSLLRKTSGPVIKMDPIFNKPNGNTYNYEPQVRSPTAGVGSIYVPPVTQSPLTSSHPQSPQFNNKIDSPQSSINQAPPFYKRQPSTPQSEPQSPQMTPQKQQPSAAAQREIQQPESPKPALSKAPTPWLTQRRQQSQDVPEWAVNDHREQSSPQEVQRQWSQQEAQKPWVPETQGQPQWPQPQPQPQQYQQQPQQQYQQQPQYQQPSQQQYQPQPQLQQYQSPPPQQQWQQQQAQQQQPWTQRQQPLSPQGRGVRNQVQNRDSPQEYFPSEQTEIVIVSDPPQVFQHPGQPQQRVIRPNNYQPQEAGTRVIPIQVEGASNGRGGNSDPRSLNRQQSWNATPIQSNSFKVLQKLTQTDGNEEEEDQVIREHSPKMTQQFTQRQASIEQMRRMQLNDGGPAPHNQQINRGPRVRTIPIQIEGEGQTKTYVPPSEQTVQEPKKYMGSSIPSRSFKILQAMTGPDDCAANQEPASECTENYSNDPSLYSSQWPYDPNYPYYYPPYWNYYPDPQNQNNSRMTPVPYPWGYYPPQNKSKEPSEKSDSDSESSRRQNLKTPTPFWPYCYPNSEGNKTDDNGSSTSLEYPPYWDPYYYYYYMPPPPMYPPMYSPYPFYGPPHGSDTEEISGYSSNEEMAYYAQRFAGAHIPPQLQPPSSESTPTNQPNSKPQTPKEVENTVKDTIKTKNTFKPAENHQYNIEDDSSIAETSDSDNEMYSYEICRNPPGLQTIRSVSDIKVYDAEESSNDEEEEEEENDESSSICNGDETIPHQLSVIFEESERTESISRNLRESSVATTISEGTATIENSEDEAAGESEDTVLVKLPLKLNFRVEESQKVATITVGTSEVTPQVAIVKSAIAEEKLKTEGEVDWWGQMDEEPKTEIIEVIEEDEKPCFRRKSEDEIDFWAQIMSAPEENTKGPEESSEENSACSFENSLSRSKIEDDKTEEIGSPDKEEEEFKLPTVQERIKALHDSSTYKHNVDEEEEEVKISIKDRITAFEEGAHLTVEKNQKRNSISRKSSVKSYEECSEEEEGDSGVTSDVSRHISETEAEDYLEIKKMNAYQRASTHSRLFKLLQDECDNEDDDDEEHDETKKEHDSENMLNRRELLNLPLKAVGSEPESFSSSGFTSPGSPTINERLVNELIQNLLIKKQGRMFKNINMDKLHAAALRILQEDMDGLETLSSSEDGGGGGFNSPKKLTPPDFQENLNEYSQYYNSWAEAQRLYEEQCETLPSKTFKFLQENCKNKSATIAGLLARCPRVLSNKNVQKELMKLMESERSPSPSPSPSDHSAETVEAASAS